MSQLVPARNSTGALLALALPITALGLCALGGPDSPRGALVAGVGLAAVAAAALDGPRLAVALTALCAVTTLSGVTASGYADIAVLATPVLISAAFVVRVIGGLRETVRPAHHFSAPSDDRRDRLASTEGSAVMSAPARS